MLVSSIAEGHEARRAGHDVLFYGQIQNELIRGPLHNTRDSIVHTYLPQHCLKMRASTPNGGAAQEPSQAKRKEGAISKRLSRENQQRTLSPLVAIFEFAGVLTLVARSGLISSFFAER